MRLHPIWTNCPASAQGITNKRWTSAAGRSWGGKPVSRGALCLIAAEPIYLGDVVHRSHSYPGEHQPIIEPRLWDVVQAKLAANTSERNTGERLTIAIRCCFACSCARTPWR